MKKEFAIEGKRINNLKEFYDEIERVLIPNVIWGRNLDALNDVLYGGFGTPEEGFRLVWEDSNISKVNLGNEETIKWINDKLLVIHPTNIEDFTERLADLKKEAGKTLFDEIVEIIGQHPDIELVLK